MLRSTPGSREHLLKLLGIMAALVCVLALFVLPPGPQPLILSRWAGPQPIAIAADSVVQAAPAASAVAAAPAVAGNALEAYNQQSQLHDADQDRLVQFYRRDVAGGSIAYFVVTLEPRVHVEVLNADNAVPGSDASGDTIWSDGQQHLAPVAAITGAPYAARAGMELLGAMAFGFHGDVRTSDEGTVVINGKLLRANLGRSALCITADGHARIGLFDAAALASCDQAIGAGPVILQGGKIADPSISSATADRVPFNPLQEDFVQLDWRKKVYTGDYPKSIIGIGQHADGRAFMVMLISNGVAGPELAAQLKAMGCTDALGGDDDSSTQAIWRGTSLQSHIPRAVPDAVAVYVRR